MKRKGFTLTEMIGAIVVLAIVISLAVVAYNGIRTSILEKDYENLVSYLETKAANYSENTGELNVTVERLISAGYVEADESNKLLDPRNKTSLNCLMFDSVYENGNYVAKKGENIGEAASGQCNTYEVNKEIQICIMDGDTCENIQDEWFNENVTLGVKIGGNQTLASKANIVWKVNGISFVSETYTTEISTINKGVYTVEVKYDVVDETNQKLKKHFEGSDTVAINVDLEKPVINSVKIEKEDSWANHDKNVVISFSDHSGSGVTKINVFQSNNTTDKCPGVSESGWVEVTSGSYSIAKGSGTYKVCVVDLAGNLSDPYPVDSLITISKIDKSAPECEVEVVSGTKGENNWYVTYPKIAISYKDDDGGSGVIAYGLSKENKVYYNKITSIDQNSDVVSQSYFGFVRDGADNTQACKLENVKVDTTKPNLSNIGESITNWTNQNVTLSSTAADNTSKLGNYAVTTSNTTPSSWTKISGSPSGYEIKYSAATNGTYYFWVKDVAGNIFNKSITVTNIDKTKPTVGDIKPSTTAWTNSNVTITSAVTDNESKLAGYAVTTSSTTPSSWTSISGKTSYTVSYSVQTNGTYYVWVKDVAGNIDKKSISIANIDKVKPTVGTPKASTTAWTNGNVTITSAISDSLSKLAYYAVTTSTSTPSSWTSISGTPANYTVSYTATSNATYYIWAKDQAGNIEKNQIAISNIDKTNPSISNLKLSKTGWTNANISIQATLADSLSKLSGYTVTGSSSTPSSWTSISGSPASYSMSYTISANGTYYVWVKDQAGNTLYKTITVSSIDKDKPSVSVSYSSQVYDSCAYTTESCYSSGSYCTQYNNNSCTHEGEVIMDYSYSSYYCNNNSSYNTYNDYYYDDWTYNTYNNSNPSEWTYNTSNSGNWYDSLLNSVSSKKKKSSSSSNNNCYGGYDYISCYCVNYANDYYCQPVCHGGYTTNWGKTASFTINASDSGSKMAGYAVTTSSSTPSSWTTISGSPASYSTNYSVSNNGTYYVWVKDNAGNTQNTTVKVVNADSTAPTISSFSIVDASGNSYNSNSIRLSINASDSGSGIAGYCFTKTNSSSSCSWQSSSTKTVTDGTNGSGSTLTYYAFVKDSVGNISAVKSASYTLYKSCSNKIASRADSNGTCSTSCGNGTRSVTHYWKDAYLGTECSTTTTSEECSSSSGCCSGCECYDCYDYYYDYDYSGGSSSSSSEPTCDYQCMADYNSAAWAGCADGCQMYNSDGELVDSSREEGHAANEYFYGQMGYGTENYNSATGEWTDPDTGDCMNCGKN